MTQEKLDEIANLWHKTKDPKYKELWYKLIKEFANGSNNTKRRPVSIDTGNKTDNGWNSVDK
jgi:hypothetical protein